MFFITTVIIWLLVLLTAVCNDMQENLTKEWFVILVKRLQKRATWRSCCVVPAPSGDRFGQRVLSHVLSNCVSCEEL